MFSGLPIVGGSELEIFFKDQRDEEFKQTFIITKVKQEITSKSERGVILTFMDKFSYSALNSYPIKGWEEVTADKIIEDEDTMKDVISEESYFSSDFTTPELKYKNFVVPVNRPFSQVITYLKNTSNFLFFRTRKEFKLKNIKDLFSGSVVGEKFIPNPKNPDYGYKIYSHRNKQLDKFKANLTLPKSKTYSFEIKKKNKKFEDYDAAIMLTDIGGLGSTELQIEDTINEKHFVKVDEVLEDSIKAQYFRNGYDLIQSEIIVGGLLETNVGNVITIELYKPDASGPDENLSGDWLITEIVDRYEQQNFAQKLTIVRTKIG